ncbi:MAG TPA: hypothetical protein VFR43_08385 [Gaiellaceae bacterium]|nr:hypothetical protein [Gaiellaceae bacterium]
MRFATRIDRRLERELAGLDVRRPVAETWRALGAAANRLGAWRPSYAAVRLVVLAERRRRAERDSALETVAWVLTRRIPPTADQIDRAHERALRRRLH